MYLNSPAPRLGNSAASRGRKGVPETSTKDGHIDSTDYLTTGSLLRGDRAICLPVSAGLPSAGGGLSDSIRMTTPSPHPITPENRFRAAGLRSQIPKLAELRKSSPSRISQTAPTPPQHTSSASSHLLKNRELLKTVSIASISNSTATISESSSRSNSIVLMNKKTSTTGIISSSRSSPPAATTTRSRQTLGYPSSLAKGESSRKSLSKRDSSFFLLSSKPFTDAEALQYKLLNSKPGRNISNSVETMDDGGGRSRVCQWGEEDDIESLSERVGSVSSNDLFSTGNREKARAYSMETTGSGWVKTVTQLNTRVKAKPIEVPIRVSREEIALQIQTSMELEKRAKELERRTYLQQRAEIVCLNHIMRIIEQTKYEQMKLKNMDGGTIQGQETAALKKEMMDILFRGDSDSKKGNCVLDDLFQCFNSSNSV